MSAEVLKELARAKVAFQLRTIEMVVNEGRPKLPEARADELIWPTITPFPEENQ